MGDLLPFRKKGRVYIQASKPDVTLSPEALEELNDPRKGPRSLVSGCIGALIFWSIVGLLIYVLMLIF
jgi:hypothetical protein